ncbi:MAG TPA: hypothetical protein VGE28_13420 [Pseudomonas sp.]
MLFLLIFPVLVAGFLACHIHPIHSYKLHRYEGQYLYLKSAELGLKCFAVAFVLSLAGHYWIPDGISLGCIVLNLELSSSLASAMTVIGANTTAEASKMAWFFLLSASTLLAAFLLKGWGHVTLRRRFGRWDSKLYVIGELLDDSPLDNLLFKLSLDKDKYVMLTMDDRKVYVGKVISLGEPSETNGMDQDVSIMPLMSGYRDKDTLVVNFNTHYEEVDADIYISLRQDSIVSATEFDFEAYKKWNPPKSAATSETSVDIP